MKKTLLNFIPIFIAFFTFFLIIIFIDIDPAHPEITRTMAVAILMAILWITEAVPLPVTALIPVVAFPFLGVMSGKHTASLYFNNVIFLFLGGFLIALAMEKWGLHRRIALKVIILIGAGYRRLLFGFMFATYFLSMWISNTATVMMMTPIAISVILQLEKDKLKEEANRFAKALLLGIAYSASVGGIATLVGTPPNAILVRIMNIYFPKIPEISFSFWFLFAFPISIILFLIIYIVLLGIYCPKGSLIVDSEVFYKEYKSLGSMSYEEKIVSFLFLLVALMWLTRVNIKIGSLTIPGWSSLFPYSHFIDDGTVAISVSLLFFFIPSKNGKFIMDWDTAKRLPWGIIILFGGGFALAEAFKISGLSSWIAKGFCNLRGVHIYVIVICVCGGVSLLTEFASNTASTQVILPVMAALSKAIGVSPFVTMVPATIAASCAFMLPVATPPNAIIFGTNRLRVLDMFKAGIIIDALAIGVVSSFSIFWFR